MSKIYTFLLAEICTASLTIIPKNGRFVKPLFRNLSIYDIIIAHITLFVKQHVLFFFGFGAFYNIVLF